MINVKEVSIEDITPYENNPRINDGAVGYVAESIKEFGFRVPIVLDKSNVIVAGHTRYKAAKQLGLQKVPCIIADDLDEQHIKAFRLADNKVQEFAQWDCEMLAEELQGIEDVDMSVFDFGECYAEPGPIDLNEIPTPDTMMVHICPKCGFKFEEKE